MRVAFVLGGVFAVELDLQIDPDPNNIAASLTNAVNTAFAQRVELNRAGPVYAVSWAGDNFGSQDGLEAGDIELSETSSIVIWAARVPKRRVARTIKQVVEVAVLEELLGKRSVSRDGPQKRRRLTDAGEYILV